MENCVNPGVVLCSLTKTSPRLGEEEVDAGHPLAAEGLEHPRGGLADARRHGLVHPGGDRHVEALGLNVLRLVVVPLGRVHDDLAEDRRTGGVVAVPAEHRAFDLAAGDPLFDDDLRIGPLGADHGLLQPFGRVDPHDAQGGSGRAGLTNTGKLSVRAISSRIRPRSVRQRRGVTSTYGATSIPADWRTTFM